MRWLETYRVALFELLDFGSDRLDVARNIVAFDAFVDTPCGKLPVFRVKRDGDVFYQYFVLLQVGRGEGRGLLFHSRTSGFGNSNYFADHNRKVLFLFQNCFCV